MNVLIFPNEDADQGDEEYSDKEYSDDNAQPDLKHCMADCRIGKNVIEACFGAFLTKVYQLSLVLTVCEEVIVF
jgi:hypothetical protein